MINNIKAKINPLMVLAVISELISVIYSITFYKEINTFFATLIVLFEITLFIYAPRIKEAKNIVIKSVMIIIVIFTASFSVLGVVANGYNFILLSNKNQYKEVISDKYRQYNVELKMLQQTKTDLQSQLIKYPSLESATINLKSWENKKETILNWQNGYDKINNEIKLNNEKISNLKVPEKYKIVRKSIKGYNAIFKLTKIKEETCIFWMTFIIAIILQFIILTSRMYKVKKLTPEKVNTKIELAPDINIIEKLAPEIKKLTPEKVSTIELPIVSEVSTKIVSTKKEELTPELTPEKVSTEKLTPKVNLKKLAPEKVSTNKNIINFDNKELIKNIERFIKQTFKIDETISVKKIIEEFNLTRKGWEKVRKDLKIIKVEGTKTKRAI
jgi:hypothetical protein